jgi:zinc transport system permease protein
MLEYIQTTIQLLNEPFMTRIIVGGIIISVLCAIVGSFITLKKESFIADGIAHASLSGVALGLVLSGQPTLFALIAAILMSLVITRIKLKTSISGDSAIGIIYPFMFALGVIIIFLRDRYSPETETYIFGNLISITSNDIIFAAIALIFTIIVVLWKYRDLVFVTFDRDSAKIRGINVNHIEYLYGILTAITVIASVKLIGIVMVTALLVVPGIFARIFAKKFSDIIPIAILQSLAAFLLGIFFSTNLPSGPVIVIFSVLILMVGIIINSFKKKR